MVDKERWDVMISYHQVSGMKYMKKIKTALLQKGYSVWADEDQVYGNLGKRMAEGVARSELILLLLSKGYEDSKNCQKEYNLVSAQHKKAICVIVEEYYEPPLDSILRLIMGNNMYYPLYNDNNDIYFRNLLKDISLQLTKEDGAAQNPPYYKATPECSVVDEFSEMCMIAYLTDKWFVENKYAYDRRQSFASALGLKDAIVRKVFRASFRTDNPILECICIKAFENKCSKEELLRSVNAAFEKEKLGYQINKYDINKGPFIIETGSSNIDLSSLNRQSKIFCIIAEKCGPDIRYVLHFLVPYTILKTWFLNKPSDVVNRTVTTLKQWIFKMKKNDATWWRIQAVLKFLRREDVIQAIVGEK